MSAADMVCAEIMPALALLLRRARPRASARDADAEHLIRSVTLGQFCPFQLTFDVV